MKNNLFTRSVLIMTVVVASFCGAHRCFDGEFLPNEDDCHSFFKCDHGRPVPFQCGPGTAWNRALLACDYTNLVPECKTTVDEQYPTIEDFTPDYQPCLPGLIFNPVSGSCDWPWQYSNWQNK